MHRRRVAIVPHTHWDREWHTPYAVLRLRLAAVVADVLTTLESDERFTCFLLDGQTEIVDDALEVRRDLEPRIRAAVSSGRLVVGPFAVLPDEFCVSAETLARALERGLRRSAELGAVHDVGYLPDSFGHTDQMPQLLRLAGIERAVVWRGVPSTVTDPSFDWYAPDGSRVRTLFLYASYANGRDLPHEPASLVRRTRALEAELSGMHDGELLFMAGGDHTTIDAATPDVVAAANAHQSAYTFAISSLAGHLDRCWADRGHDRAPSTASTGVVLTTHRGELRSGAHANLLAGVISHRVDLRRAARRAEVALEDHAERLDAVLGTSDTATRALERAARDLVRNAAHDSVCGCSSDDVVHDVLGRYRAVRDVAQAITDETVARLARLVGTTPTDVVAVNTGVRARNGFVEVEADGTVTHSIDASGRCSELQVLERFRPEVFAAVVSGRKLSWVAERADERGFDGRPIGEVRRVEHDTGAGRHTDVLLLETADPDQAIDCRPLRSELEALGAGATTVSVRVLGAPRQRVLADTGRIPGLGWSTITLTSTPATAATPPMSAARAPVLHVEENAMHNEHLRVEIDPADGTWSMRDFDGLEARGLGRIVDGGDAGDSYTFSPPPDDVLVESPRSVHCAVVERGPLRACVEITRTYDWPAAAIADDRRGAARRPDTVEAVVVIRLELRVDEPMLRVRVELENPARDHRVRLHLPLPERASRSSAGAPFSVVVRPPEGEGGPHELAVGTYPATDFVDAGSERAALAVLVDAVTEYELVGDGEELALTLLRATGYLARREPHARLAPAGPQLPTPDAQLIGALRRDFALVLHHGDWEEGDVVGLLPAFHAPLASATHETETDTEAEIGTGRGARLDRAGSWYDIEGAEVTSMRRKGDTVVLRAVRRATTAGTLRVSCAGAPATGTVVDLRGRPIRRFDGSVPMGPFEIVTLRLRRVARM